MEREDRRQEDQEDGGDQREKPRPRRPERSGGQGQGLPENGRSQNQQDDSADAVEVFHGIPSPDPAFLNRAGRQPPGAHTMF